PRASSSRPTDAWRIRSSSARRPASAAAEFSGAVPRCVTKKLGPVRNGIRTPSAYASPRFSLSSTKSRPAIPPPSTAPSTRTAGYAGPGVRMASVELPQQRVEAPRERRLGTCLDLAQDEPPLALDLLARERGLEGDLGDEPEQPLPVTRERFAADLRGLHLPRRVQV